MLGKSVCRLWALYIIDSYGDGACSLLPHGAGVPLQQLALAQLEEPPQEALLALNGTSPPPPPPPPGSDPDMQLPDHAAGVDFNISHDLNISSMPGPVWEDAPEVLGALTKDEISQALTRDETLTRTHRAYTNWLYQFSKFGKSVCRVWAPEEWIWRRSGPVRH